MISWKHSFEGLNEEYEITMKKKQALDNLLNSGKISESTYDLFNQKMAEAVADIQSRQTALLEKMNSKAEQLEQHVRTLEMLLANFEIRHVAGEIDQEVYEREINLFSAGLENAKQELDTVKDAMSQLSNNLPVTAIDIDTQPDTELQTTEEVETTQTELENDEEEAPQVIEIDKDTEEVDNLPEPPTGSTEEELDSDDSQESAENAWDNPQQTWTNTEETYETAESMEETPPPEESSEEYESTE